MRTAALALTLCLTASAAASVTERTVRLPAESLPGYPDLLDLSACAPPRPAEGFLYDGVVWVYLTGYAPGELCCNTTDYTRQYRRNLIVRATMNLVGGAWGTTQHRNKIGPPFTVGAGECEVSPDNWNPCDAETGCPDSPAPPPSMSDIPAEWMHPQPDGTVLIYDDPDADGITQGSPDYCGCPWFGVWSPFPTTTLAAISRNPIPVDWLAINGLLGRDTRFAEWPDDVTITIEAAVYVRWVEGECDSDWDGDGDVDVFDLLELLAWWDYRGVFRYEHLLSLLEDWGECP